MRLRSFLPSNNPPQSPRAKHPSASTLVSRPLGREEEAQHDLEHTYFGRGAAWGITLLFIASLLVMPLVQIFGGRARSLVRSTPAAGQQSGARPSLFALTSLDAGKAPSTSAWHLPTFADVQEFANHLKDHAPTEQWAVPRAQRVLLELGGGNGQVCVGRDQWLMYRPDVEYLTGPGFMEAATLRHRAHPPGDEPPTQPDPLKAIVAFRDQLAQRGIQLVLLPTPLKPMVQPEQLGAFGAPPQEVLQNVSYAAFCRALQERGVLVCDPSATIFAEKTRTGLPQYLRTDTHWTPHAMDATAQYVTEFLGAHAPLPARAPVRYGRVPVNVTNRGDIAGMLKLPERTNPFALQHVRTQRVQTPDGARWKANRGADVLLLGDSFTNIYSRPALGWGEAGGLGEQMSFYLQRHLDVIAVNAGGAAATRRLLRDEMLRGRDRLKGKRVVVWQFAMRDLAQGDWKQLDLPDPHAAVPAPLRSIALPNWRVEAKGRAPLTLVPASSEFLHALNERATEKESEKWVVLPGDHDWLFPMLDYYYSVTPFLRAGEKPKDLPQVKALVDLKRQLAARGIELLVVPVPPKTMIHPEHLCLEGIAPSDMQSDGSTMVAVAQNPSFAPYKAALEAAGIKVFDPTVTLLEAKRATSAPLFVPGDAHWSFVGVDVTAWSLARFLEDQDLLSERDPVFYVRHAAQVQHTPDLWRVQARATGEEFHVTQSQTVQRVYNPNGEHLSIRPTPDSDVLLLGDSFSNIYSHGGPWGSVSGLAEQLSYYLQRPVNRISVEGGAVNTTREELRDRMLRGEDPLAGKKLVIYEFTSRALLSRKWKKIALPTLKEQPPTAPSDPAAMPQSVAPVTLQGQVVACAPVPDPTRAPYPDLVMAVHLRGVRRVGEGDASPLPSDMLVYTWGMRDHALTPATAWHAGQTVTLRAVPWAQADEEYGSYNRAEIEDVWEARKVARLKAYWGE